MNTVPTFERAHFITLPYLIVHSNCFEIDEIEQKFTKFMEKHALEPNFMHCFYFKRFKFVITNDEHISPEKCEAGFQVLQD